MLKNVVLPAPFGPMIETIDRRGTANDTSFDRDEAAETFVTCRAARGGRRRRSRSRRAVGAVLARVSTVAPRRRVSSVPRPRRARVCAFARAAGPRVSAPSSSRAGSRRSPKLQLGQVEVQPELAAAASVEHVGDEVGVDVGERERAEHHPPDRPRPPRMTIASTKIENENSNWSALTVLQVGAEEGARHPAEGRAGRVGQQLGLAPAARPCWPAATSSSRIAIQARPSRESRSAEVARTARAAP